VDDIAPPLLPAFCAAFRAVTQLTITPPPPPPSQGCCLQQVHWRLSSNTSPCSAATVFPAIRGATQRNATQRRTLAVLCIMSRDDCTPAHTHTHTQLHAPPTYAAPGTCFSLCKSAPQACYSPIFAASFPVTASHPIVSWTLYMVSPHVPTQSHPVAYRL
jgi:hypothetical protein